MELIFVNEIYGARVRGLENSSGKYVLFLDQDDQICPDYFLSQLQCIRDNDGVVCQVIHEKNGFIITSCELKVYTIKKPENPTVPLTISVDHELSVLCVILAFDPKGGKMLPKIMHKGRFRDSPFRRGPLIAELAGMDLPDKTNGKALKNPHGDTRQGHMHFNGAYGFQHLFTGFFAFHMLQGCWLSLLLVIAQFWHML